MAARQQKDANWEETLSLAKEGKVDEVSAEHQIKYYATLNKISNDERKKRVKPVKATWKRNSEGGTPPHMWIYGPTGTGTLPYLYGNRF